MNNTNVVILFHALAAIQKGPRFLWSLLHPRQNIKSEKSHRHLHSVRFSDENTFLPEKSGFHSAKHVFIFVILFYRRDAWRRVIARFKFYVLRIKCFRFHNELQVVQKVLHRES